MAGWYKQPTGFCFRYDAEGNVSVLYFDRTAAGMPWTCYLGAHQPFDLGVEKGVSTVRLLIALLFVSGVFFNHHPWPGYPTPPHPRPPCPSGSLLC